MTPISVLTLVRNRAGHLDQLVEGLRRSAERPAELIVVDMSDEPVVIGPTDFAIHVERLPTIQLPLARARNIAAARAAHDTLVFLDVDCIPMRDCLGRLATEVSSRDGLFCADVRYLGPGDARGAWTEAELLKAGRSHAVRDFPAEGVRTELNPGLFWSLAFAVDKNCFDHIGGFDEGFEGYGAEDTDFGFRAASRDVPLLFVGGAIACHQHHESFEPPVQHLEALVHNAQHFFFLWRKWPMEGWLTALERMGLIAWTADDIQILRKPTAVELASCRQA